jgi:hypothetical protein
MSAYTREIFVMSGTRANFPRSEMVLDGGLPKTSVMLDFSMLSGTRLGRIVALAD